MLTEQEKKEITETITASIKDAIQAANAEQAAAEKREKIMAIRNPIERQQAISENMELFRG